MALINPQDIQIGRGDNSPAPAWHMPFDVTGSVFELRVWWAGGFLLIRTDDDDSTLVVSPVARTVTWEITSAQSGVLPLGRLTQYTLRRIVPLPGGEVRYYAAGTITTVLGPVTNTSPTLVVVQGPQGAAGIHAWSELLQAPVGNPADLLWLYGWDRSGQLVRIDPAGFADFASSVGAQLDFSDPRNSGQR